MIIFLVVLVVLIGICVGLYFFGKKAEKKQAEQKEQMDAVAQTVSMLVIDKKRLKLKEAGLPAAVVENTPKYLRRTRVPIVKAKIGPKIMTLMCEEKVFEVLPVKKEAKVVLSGIYITGIKSVRGGIPASQTGAELFYSFHPISKFLYFPIFSIPRITPP